MAKIKVSGKVIAVERDGKVRRLARVYTDAVGPNADVPDERELEDACDQALDATKDCEDIDGVELAPWPKER